MPAEGRVNGGRVERGASRLLSGALLLVALASFGGHFLSFEVAAIVSPQASAELPPYLYAWYLPLGSGRDPLPLDPWGTAYAQHPTGLFSAGPNRVHEASGAFPPEGDDLRVQGPGHAISPLTWIVGNAPFITLFMACSWLSLVALWGPRGRLTRAGLGAAAPALLFAQWGELAGGSTHFNLPWSPLRTSSLCALSAGVVAALASAYLILQATKPPADSDSGGLSSSGHFARL